MKVIIECDVSAWANPSEFAAMDDEQVVSLLREDVVELLDNARWTVVREESERE